MRRKFWLNIHLYFGLITGMFFIVIGITGSLLVFEQPLDEWLNKELMTPPVYSQQNAQMPIDVIMQAALKAVPSNGRAINLDFPKHEGTAFVLWFEQISSSNSEDLERHQIFINPYTADIMGQRLLIDFKHIWRDPLVDFILRLHYSLGLASVGMNIVGFMGLGLLCTIFTGLLLWWPASLKQLKKVFSIKWKSSAERFNYDLHKSFGALSFIILLLLIVSGLYLVFPKYGQGLIEKFSPIAPAWPLYQSTVENQTRQSMSLRDILAIADSHFPESKYRYIIFPTGADGVYEVGKTAMNEPNQRHPSYRIWIDPYTGKIFEIRNDTLSSAGDTFIKWLYLFHTGEAFGLTGQLIVLFMGFVPLLLYVTGFKRWQQKLRVRKFHESQKINGMMRHYDWVSK